MNTYAISGPTSLYQNGVQHDAVTLRNLGTETIYLASSPITATAQGFPLGSGSSMVWDANRALYAFAVAGTLGVSDNSGNIFDASSVAAELIASGLASQIAAQIAIGGAPPLPLHDVIYDAEMAVGTSVDIDVSRYSTLTVIMYAAVATTGLTRSRLDFVSSGVAIAEREHMLVCNDPAVAVGSQSRYTIPVTSGTARIYNATGSGGSTHYTVIGHTNTMPYSFSTISPGVFGPGAPYEEQSESFSLARWSAAHTAATSYIGTRSGPCTLFADADGTGSGTFALRDALNGKNLHAPLTVSSGNPTSVDFVMPDYPVTLYHTTGAGGAWFAIEYQ